LLVTVSTYTRGQDFGDAALVVDQLGEPGDGATALTGDLGGNEVVNVAVLQRLRDDVFDVPIP
jgi:hypothetical protein